MGKWVPNIYSYYRTLPYNVERYDKTIFIWQHCTAMKLMHANSNFPRIFLLCATTTTTTLTRSQPNPGMLNNSSSNSNSNLFPQEEGEEKKIN